MDTDTDTPTKKQLKNWINLLKKEIYSKDLYRSYVEHKSERTNCDGSCRERNDYCRCTKIYDARVVNVDLEYFLSCIFLKNSSNNIIDKYCVDRIIRIHKLYEPSSWEISVVGGYYGQELDQMMIIPQIANAIWKDALVLSKLKTVNEKIEFILTVEYGYLLDSGKKKNWSVKSISPKLIGFGQNEYVKKIQKSDIYDNYKLPLAICIKKGKEVRIIDGYHRMANHRNDKNVKVIIGE